MFETASLRTKKLIFRKERCTGSVPAGVRLFCDRSNLSRFASPEVSEDVCVRNVQRTDEDLRMSHRKAQPSEL